MIQEQPKQNGKGVLIKREREGSTEAPKPKKVKKVRHVIRQTDPDLPFKITQVLGNYAKYYEDFVKMEPVEVIEISD